MSGGKLTKKGKNEFLAFKKQKIKKKKKSENKKSE